jgi:hypothetical protein
MREHCGLTRNDNIKLTNNITEENMDTKKSLTVFIIICLVVGVAMVSSQQSIAQASSPTDADGVTVPYAWTLTDASGRSSKDGVYAFTFALYDAKEGGNLLWSEQQSDVKVSSGKVNIELGAVTLIPTALLENKEAQYWLAVSVRGSAEKSFTELSPRQAILLSPQSPEALTCPHSHFTDYWYGSTTNGYGLVVSNAGTGDGVRGYSNSTTNTYAGIYGVNNGGTTGGTGGSGIYGYSSNGYAGYFEGHNYNGLLGTSDSAIGVYAVDGGADHDNSWALYADGDIYTNDDLTVGDHLAVGGTSTFTGAKTGFVVDVAQNDDKVSLEAGDVVVISGAGSAVIGEIPVIKVRRASESDSSAVVGVVDQHYIPAPKPAQTTGQGEAKVESTFEDETIQPGEYLTVVTLGSYKIIKVDASFGAIEPGDLLVSSTNPGYAMVSHDPKVGTVIGKALEGLASGTGTIAVLISYQ